MLRSCCVCSSNCIIAKHVHPKPETLDYLLAGSREQGHISPT